MKLQHNTIVRGFAVLCTASLLAAMPACKVKKTQEGRAPEVEVKADPGALPKYDVDAADVNVKTEDEKVLVPKVIMQEETVAVPKVDVTMPPDDNTPPAPAPAPANP